MATITMTTTRRTREHAPVTVRVAVEIAIDSEHSTSSGMPLRVNRLKDTSPVMRVGGPTQGLDQYREVDMMMISRLEIMMSSM